MTAWTDRMKRELADVPIKPIDELRALPECGDLDGGIYFLWLGETLQYIGKSKQICYRLQLHDQQERKFPFDRHTCLVVESGWFFSADLPLKLKRLERAYIAHYQPPHNCLHQNPGT